MEKKFYTVFLLIKWEHAVVERVRLDLGALSKNPKQVIHTHESRGKDKPILYHPRATYRKDDDANHVIQLEYSAQDHPELKGHEVFWGVTTIKVDKVLTRATVIWKGKPTIEGKDGKAGCQFWVERPSEKKAIIAEARKAQHKFKEALLKLGSECVITGENLLPLLDAAHILSVEHGGSDEPENGVLLRADLHRLFDAGYFTIKTDGSLELHPDMPRTYARMLKEKHIAPHVVERIRPYLPKRRQPHAA